MRPISLKLPADLLARLEREASVRGVSKWQLVRESLEKSLDPKSVAAEMSCFEAARDLIGKMRGLPKDLATNPKYMNGFGE